MPSNFNNVYYAKPGAGMSILATQVVLANVTTSIVLKSLIVRQKRLDVCKTEKVS